MDEEAQIRVRRGWGGKAILQVRESYRYCITPYTMIPSKFVTRYRWVDVNFDDLVVGEEVLMKLAELKIRG